MSFESKKKVSAIDIGFLFAFLNGKFAVFLFRNKNKRRKADYRSEKRDYRACDSPFREKRYGRVKKQKRENKNENTIGYIRDFEFGHNYIVYEKSKNKLEIISDM